MNFRLRVEGEFAKFFTMKPETGVIPAKSQMKMKITCVPQVLGLIHATLLLDVKEIGDGVSSLNIEAFSNAPEV